MFGFIHTAKVLIICDIQKRFTLKNINIHFYYAKCKLMLITSIVYTQLANFHIIRELCALTKVGIELRFVKSIECTVLIVIFGIV